MRPEDVDLSGGERIAFASSEGDGRERWTELAVYHFDQPPTHRRNWMAVSIGRSVVAGERDKERRLLVGSLERALKLFDEGTELGVIVCEEAREWEYDREHGHFQTRFPSPDVMLGAIRDVEPDSVLAKLYDVLEGQSATAIPTVTSEQVGNAILKDIARGWHPYTPDDRAALAYLYDVPADDLPSVNSMASDLGMSESTLRAALKNGTGAKVPLQHVAALIDRALFRQRREAERDA